MVELGVRDLGPAPGLSVSVRLRMDAAEGIQVRVLLRIDVDRVRIPCPYVHEPEVWMEEHELRTGLGMDLGAACGGRAGEIAIVPVVTARLVLEPPSAGKRVGGRPVRHRIFDGGELQPARRRRDGRLAELAEIIDEMAPHRSAVQSYRSESHRDFDLCSVGPDERDEEATTR